MANSLITLLDLTKRTGVDQAVGLVEETITYAPELRAIGGREISGTTYKFANRTLPTVAFRQPNNGSDTIKSAYNQSIGQCFLIDAQLQIDKAVADAEAKSAPPPGQQNALGNIMGDEATGVLMASYITIGTQFYKGVSADANGFIGLQSFYDSTNMEVSAGATPGGATSVWIVWENIKGVHFVFGNNQGLNMLPEWRIQQVNGANSKPLTAYVNNLQGWLGLACNHSRAIGRIKLVDATHPITDKLIAQLLAKFPLQMRGAQISGNQAPGLNTWGGGLKIFMTPNAAFYLQNSRSAATTALTASNPLAYASLPVESNGVPIVLTNSISETE